jgi:hypothetical protein
MKSTKANAKRPTQGGGKTPARKRTAKAKAKARSSEVKKKRPQWAKSGGRSSARKPARPQVSGKKARPVKAAASSPRKAKPQKAAQTRKTPPASKPRRTPRPQPAKPVKRAKPPQAKRPAVKAPKRPIKVKRPIAPPAHKPIPRKPARPTAREIELERKRRNRRDRERRAEKKRQDELDRKRRKWKRKRKKSGGAPAAPAVGWLRRMLTHCREVFACDLETTFPSGGVGEGAADDREIAEQAKKSPWLVVGKFTPEDEIGYAELAEAFSRIEGDYLLEAEIDPDRLTQVRIIFDDPKSKLGEGEAIVAKVGAYSFVWSDLIGELVGAGDADSPGEESLAARYKETAVPTFYVFLSEVTVQYKTAAWTRTQQVKL